MSIPELEQVLATLSADDRQIVFGLLRTRYGVSIHPLERKWNTSAEAILEAIDQAPDLTQRGIRGILAEATFRTTVVPRDLAGWASLPVVGDQSYDLLLADDVGQVRIQVKLQRRELGIPKLHRGQPGVFVVETQRTRTGKAADNTQTRPYRTDEFDVLAVSLQPSTGDWTTFIYCATTDLAVRPENPQLLQVMQPITMSGSETWSSQFEHAVRRFRATIPPPGH